MGTPSAEGRTTITCANGTIQNGIGATWPRRETERGEKKSVGASLHLGKGPSGADIKVRSKKRTNSRGSNK
jgi:hypothetical protein